MAHYKSNDNNMNDFRFVIFKNIHVINWLLCIATVLFLGSAIIYREYSNNISSNEGVEYPYSIPTDSLNTYKTDTLKLAEKP